MTCPHKKTFGFCDGSTSFPTIFVFTRIRLYPLSGEILYHDIVSVIVSRFRSLMWDFVICRYQVIKLFCAKWTFASASSAKNPRSFGSQACVAIRSLGSEKRYCASVFVSPLLKRRLPSVSSLYQRNVRAHTSPSPRHLPWRAATNQAYLALDPPCTSRLKKIQCWFTVSRRLLVGICQHRFPACMLVTSSRDWVW